MREEFMDLAADEERVSAPPLQPEQAKSNSDATAFATNDRRSAGRSRLKDSSASTRNASSGKDRVHCRSSSSLSRR